MAEKDALSAESAKTLRKLVRVYAEVLEDIYSNQTAFEVEISTSSSTTRRSSIMNETFASDEESEDDDDLPYECPDCGVHHDGMTTGTEWCFSCYEDVPS